MTEQLAAQTAPGRDGSFAEQPAAIMRDRLYLGGRWTSPAGDDTFDVVSPSTEKVVGTVPAGTPVDVDRAVAAAREAFDAGPWRWVSPTERAARLQPVLAGLRKRHDELVRLLVGEVGVPISSCSAIGVAQPIRTLEYYLGLAATFPFEETRGGLRGATVVREPVGVVAAIVPWNAPLRSIMNKLAPALVAGCSVVVKPAPETPLNAFVLAEVLAEADLPPGLVSIVPAGRETGEHLVRHPGVDKVAFTGSTAAGRRIMAACAENLTRVGLELGGKSAAIVLDDADLDVTVRRLTPLVVGNNGQACTAQTRILVSRARHDELVEVLVAAFAAQRVGDPFDPATDVGPLVSKAQYERVTGYLETAAAEGARVAVGGGRPAGLDVGWYVEPTVLIGVDNGMRVAREEIFGPVAVMIPYDDVEQAVAIADDSPYGLAGSVWTGDVAAGMAVARRIRTGTFSVNGAAQPVEAPFGGFKGSGIGREYGPEGLDAFCEKKSIATRLL
ncbi:aldehyde dehydrogenase [Frankia sp. Cr2]|uniref:aldehyde dehydrogenase n=1 Tax=Frankia sp. Cr2 TaxID=3073932 RepID=UPI002AD466B0|nr:aldehyde dehydrogenase [Frankia sp. Cr2]